jgi:hypothetical protein
MTCTIRDPNIDLYNYMRICINVYIDLNPKPRKLIMPIN